MKPLRCRQLSTTKECKERLTNRRRGADRLRVGGTDVQRQGTDGNQVSGNNIIRGIYFRQKNHPTP